MQSEEELDWLYRAQQISNIGNWDQEYPDGKLWWSDQVYRIFGMEPQSQHMDYEKFLDYVHPQDRQIIRRATEEALSTENVPYKIEYRLQLDNLGVRYIYEDAVVDRNDNGEPIKMAGIIQDITSRKKAEIALQESENLYRSLVESTSAVAWEMDIESQIFTYVSPVIEEVLGYTPEQFSDFDFWADHVHEDDRLEAVNFCMIETKEGRDHEFEYRFITADGKIIWLKDIVALVYRENQLRSLRGFFLDITDLKEKQSELEEVVADRTRETLVLQKELMIKEKLAEVGRLAAGVRHDLRNPLGVISNSAYFLKMKLGDDGDEKIIKHLSLIEKESDHCNDIISELLDYSKVVNPMRLETKIGPFIREQVERSNLPQGVSVKIDCDSSLCKAMIDPAQISRTLINLINNASEAMNGVGDLQISCHSKDDMVEISISDTGMGIAQEHIKRVFDPLFSTKEKGMGMGLANVKNFVELHKGTIDVESEEGKGTTFTLMLPVD